MDNSTDNMQEQNNSKAEAAFVAKELKKSICEMQYEIDLLENIIELLKQHK